MEGVLLKVRFQIIADFNMKNAAKWRTFIIGHFNKMECKKIAICRMIQLVDAGESPILLCYVKTQDLSYLHVKFHHAEGIFTIYIDHFTFPPNYVRPVICYFVLSIR